MLIKPPSFRIPKEARRERVGFRQTHGILIFRPASAHRVSEPLPLCRPNSARDSGNFDEALKVHNEKTGDADFVKFFLS